MHKDTLEKKLRNIINDNKPKYVTVNGKKHYVSRKAIDNIREKEEREGGFLPLIPLILGGLSAAGALAGGAAGVAKTVLDKKANDAELAEKERHNKEMEKAVGRGLKEQIKNFVEKSGLEEEAKMLLKKTLKTLADTIHMEPEKNGDGLYLNPAGKGLFLNPDKEN